MALPLQAQACLFRNFLQNLALDQAGHLTPGQGGGQGRTEVENTLRALKQTKVSCSQCGLLLPTSHPSSWFYLAL